MDFKAGYAAADGRYAEDVGRGLTRPDRRRNQAGTGLIARHAAFAAAIQASVQTVSGSGAQAISESAPKAAT